MSTRAPASSRFRIGSRRRTAACSTGSKSRNARVESIGPAADRAHDDAVGVAAGGHVSPRSPGSRRDGRSRVQVEDDQPQRRLQQELLENRAEGVRLPGTGLSAEERVPVEPAASRPKRTPSRRMRLADVEGTPAGVVSVKPPRDGLRLRPHDRRLVEQEPVAVEDDTVAPGEGDAEVGRVGDLLGDRGDEPGLRPGRPRSHAPGRGARVDGGVAAGLQREVVDRAGR